MKTKVLLIASAAILATAVYLHHGHQPPADGNCPIMSALTKSK